MRLLAFIGIGFGLFFGLIFFFIYIGIPTIRDRYLEQETLKSKFNAFSDSLTTCDIEVIPEVLDRLIIETKFDHLGGGQEIVKDIEIKVFVDNVEQERIFDIRFIEATLAAEEARINDFDELPANSRYRDFAFTIQSQYQLEEDDEFELKLKAVLLDTLTEKERTAIKAFKIINESEFKFEKFKGH